MKIRSAILLSFLLTNVPVFAQQVEYPPPSPLPAEMSGEQMRSQLLQMREQFCKMLELEAGIIINTAILPDVPPRIGELTGLEIHELEEKETAACSRPTEQMAIKDLRHNVRTLEWLVRIHLAAMRDVTEQNPRMRPVNAEKSFGDLFELHDIIVVEMRDHLKALTDEPTMEEAKALATFWTDVLQPHAVAEDEVVWAMAKKQNEGLARAAVLLEEEHGHIDRLIADYMNTLQKVKNGEARLEELIEPARAVRRRTELHFGKEEQSVYRPLQERLTAETFQPVVRKQANAIGGWLRSHGWEPVSLEQ